VGGAEPSSVDGERPRLDRSRRAASARSKRSAFEGLDQDDARHLTHHGHLIGRLAASLDRTISVCPRARAGDDVLGACSSQDAMTDCSWDLRGYDRRVLPNFFVVGVEKAGTTSFHEYLKAHPQVYMSPVKEPTFFALDGVVPPPPEPHWPERRQLVADRAAYERLFEGVDGETAIGESSVAYLKNQKASGRIKKEIPHARIMMILRDPSERALSAHTMYVNRGMELITDFEEAIDRELAGGTWRQYFDFGLYSSRVARYMDLFGADRVKVFLYEDFKMKPSAVLREAFEFLEVDPAFTPDTSRSFNVSEAARSQAIARFVKGRSRAKSAAKRVVPGSLRTAMKRQALELNRARPPTLSPHMRRRLVELYAEDISRLEALIGRDLTRWKTA